MTLKQRSEVIMLLSQKQTSTILDEVQQKFGHILGQTWSVAASKVASLPDGTAALGDRLTIWNGKDTFVVDCNDNTCQLSKLTFEKKEGWGIPFIWGCAQQVPDASRFASSHIGNVDAGNIQELPTAQDGEGADATSLADSCEDGNKMCLVDTVSQTQDTVDASDSSNSQDIIAIQDTAADVVDVSTNDSKQDTMTLIDGKGQDATDSNDTKDVGPDVADATANPDATIGPCVEWEKQYTIGDAAYPTSVRQENGGGYVFAGSSVTSDPTGSTSAFLLKTDSFGNKMWDNTYGLNTTANSVQQASDGGFILGGGSMLIKTDNAGTMIWKMKYPVSSAYFAQQTSDGGYALLGVGAGTATKLIKTDPMGNEEWEQIYAGLHESYSGQQTVDNGYILSGYYKSQTSLMKINSFGFVQWSKMFYLGIPDDPSARVVQQTLDGGFIVAGMTNTSGLENVRFLVKTNSNGDEEWKKTFIKSGKECVVTFAKQATNGGYMVGGRERKETVPADYWAFITRTDSKGNVLWDNVYGQSVGAAVESGQFTEDGGIIIVGRAFKSAWLKKICPSN